MKTSMQRGHNRNTIFFSDADYRKYLRILKKVADQFECQIHAYVLMTNHVHLLVTPFAKESISQLFQALGRAYVTYVNKAYKRSGTLWEGRHKGHIIDTENYFLSCMPLGSQCFLDDVEKRLACKVGFLKRGRPGKE